MSTLKGTSSMDLIERLGSALAGTHGRLVTTDSLRTLVDLEVSEWRSELQTQNVQEDDNSALITPKSGI